MYTCICNWVILLYSRKLTEQRKPAIVEKIKIIIKERRKERKRERKEGRKKEKKRKKEKNIDTLKYAFIY